MTYEEAKSKLTDNKNVIGENVFVVGKNFGGIRHMIISSRDRLNEVTNAYFKNGYNNQQALIEVGIIDSNELDVFLFTDMRTGNGNFISIEEHLNRLK